MAEKKEVERKTNFLRIFNTYLVIYQLITIPVAHAQAGTQNLLMGIPGLIKKVGNDIIQGKRAGQEAFMQAQQQGDPFAPKTKPSEYFPECQVPVKNPSLSNACQSIPVPEDQMGFAILQRSLGLVNQYQFASTEGLTATNNCLQHALSKRQRQLFKSINEINELINQQNSSHGSAKQELESILSNIQDTAHVLHGGKGDSPNTKGRTFHGLFSPGCQELIGTENFDVAKSKGLRGLKDKMAPQQEMANRFTNPENQKIHTEDIRDQINALKGNIENYGPEAWKPNYQSVLATGNTEYPSIGRAMQREITNFKSEMSRIRTDLKAIGYELPSADHQFQEKVGAFSKNSRKFFESEYIKTCVNQTPTLNPQKILQGLRHRSTGERGTALINYRDRLKGILENNFTMEQKVQAMKQLDADYRGAIVLGAGTSAPPYTFFEKQTSFCRNKIQQLNAAGTDSMALTIDKSDRAIKEALNLEESFASKFFEALYDEVVNCSGKPVKTATCNLNQVNSVLAPNGSNFCVAHATECGKRVNSCHGAVGTLIKVNEGKRDSQAARYNSLVVALEKNQKARLEKMKANVLALIQEVNAKLPKLTSSIKWPDDLAMDDITEANVDKWGVSLKDGGDLGFLDRLSEKYKRLEEYLTDKSKEIDKEMLVFAKEDRKRWEDEKKNWEEVKRRCEGVMNDYQKGMQEQMAARQEQENQAQSFCHKYDSLRSNPGAGCDSVDELFEDAMQASAFINPAIYGEINLFQQYCNSINNEALPSDSESSSSLSDWTPAEHFSNACEESGDDWEAILEDMRERAAASIPVQSFNDEQLQAIEDAISDNSKISELDREIRRTPFFRAILSPLGNIYNQEIEVSSLRESDITSDYLKGRLEKANNLLRTSGPSTISNLCKAGEYEKMMGAIEECKNADAGRYRRCYQREIDRDSELPSFVKKAGRILQSLERFDVVARNQEFGQQLGTPCMAIQGHNGALGGDVSPFSEYDEAILGVPQQNSISR